MPDDTNTQASATPDNGLADRTMKHLRTAIIIITHNIGVARHLADRVAVLYKGEIVEMGETKKVLENPQHPYTKSLMAAVPKLAYAMEKEV